MLQGEGDGEKGQAFHIKRAWGIVQRNPLSWGVCRNSGLASKWCKNPGPSFEESLRATQKVVYSYWSKPLTLDYIPAVPTEWNSGWVAFEWEISEQEMHFPPIQFELESGEMKIPFLPRVVGMNNLLTLYAQAVGCCPPDLLLHIQLAAPHILLSSAMQDMKWSTPEVAAPQPRNFQCVM